MRPIKIVAFLFLLLNCQCRFFYDNNKTLPTSLSIPKVYEFSGTSIRAIKAINENELHFAGSDGSYGFTKNQGKNWEINSIKVKGKSVHFRGIEITKRGTFLMGIASPAYLIFVPKNTKDWRIIYQEDHEKAFYDAIQIKDNLGVMMGDPTDECLSVVISKDTGKTWHKVPCDKLPKIKEGVAAFAASNSNVAIQGDHIWLVTGGVKALVYHSSDAGETWRVHQTPIAEGKQMTGIFACDFRNKKNGVIVGGDWNNKANNKTSIALTTDGGKTWTIPNATQQIGFNSDIQFLPKQKNSLIAASSEHLMLSKDLGKTWQKINELKPYTLQMVSSQKGWAAGKEFIAFFEIPHVITKK